MIPVSSGVNGGDWIACDTVGPGMGGRCIVSIVGLLPRRFDLQGIYIEQYLESWCELVDNTPEVAGSN